MLALVGAFVAVAGVAAPAQAYDSNVALRYERVYTGTCTDAGLQNWFTSESGDKCENSGLHTSFTFPKDPGGVGLAIAVQRLGEELGTVQFRPYGEVFEVCDRKNDNDTIYARLRYQVSGNWFWMSTVRPPGTSKVNDCIKKDYSFAEGRSVRVYVYDDSSLSKPILTLNRQPAMGGRA